MTVNSKEISMLRSVFVLLLFFGSLADANPTTVQDFRGTVQTVTTTGAYTLSLGSTTTIVRFNPSGTDAQITGITGGADGRVVFLWNVGSANVLLYQEHASASSASDRLAVDANTGYRTLYSNGTGIAMMIYDGTSSRWRLATLESYNTTGSQYINGELGVLGVTSISGTLSTGSTTVGGTSGTTRLTLKPWSAGNNGSNLLWQNSAGSSLFAMGPDYNGNAGHDFWLYDSANGLTNLYINNSGTSYLSFGTSYGGIQYAESGDELGLYASGLTRLRLTGNAFKIGTHPYYQKRTSGTTNTSLACTETTSEAMGTDAMDARGSFTTGTGQTGDYTCTLTFGVPWDLSTDVGKPICTATTSSTGVAVAVSAMTDHEVTFTLSAPGNVTVYYHCDGLIPAP